MVLASGSRFSICIEDLCGYNTGLCSKRDVLHFVLPA